jgi:hypothetical protein
MFLYGILNWWESQKVRDHWEDQDAGGWTILKKTHLREIGWDGMDWLDLAPNRDQWRALVNHKMLGLFVEWLHNWQLLKKGSAP